MLLHGTNVTIADPQILKAVLYAYVTLLDEKQMTDHVLTPPLGVHLHTTINNF